MVFWGEDPGAGRRARRAVEGGPFWCLVLEVFFPDVFCFWFNHQAEFFFAMFAENG